MNATKIEWTTFTANPLKYRRKSDGKVVWGCVKTSPGCAHCYSEALALRFDRGKLFNARNMEELEPFLDDTEMAQMASSRKKNGTEISGLRCFVSDMTDLFGEWVPDDLLNRLFSSVLELRTDVTWQLLTKRADRLQRYLSWRWGEGRIPSRNIQVGVSVENQQTADERIPLLLQTPAAVRFLSCETLLEGLDLWRYLQADMPWKPIDWVIVGGESGSQARPCNLDWMHSIVRQCRDADKPVFVKQLGFRPLSDEDRDAQYSKSGTKYALGELLLRDRKGGDLSEFPEDLRIREFPEVNNCD